jgi:hypothetical protein
LRNKENLVASCNKKARGNASEFGELVKSKCRTAEENPPGKRSKRWENLQKGKKWIGFAQITQKNALTNGGGIAIFIIWFSYVFHKFCVLFFSCGRL